MLNRLKELRLEKNLKQSELAIILKCSQQMVSKYEKNYTSISSIAEERASYFFECSIEYLRGISNIRNPQNDNSLTNEFCNLGIIKEGQVINAEQLNLLRELINVNKGFFKSLSPISIHVIA